MAWELVLWLFVFVSIICLIGVTAYQLICLSDLEFDYINPYDSSSRINAAVIPEFLVQALLSVIFLLTWHWFSFLMMAPVTYYHLRLYLKRRHLIDVTEIFRLLGEEKKRRMIKLAYYVAFFIFVVFRLVVTAVAVLEDGDHAVDYR
ncbi:protein cornichon homolog 2-like [Wolffia australiana]